MNCEIWIQEEQKAPSRISRAKKRIQKALGRTKGLERLESAVPTLSGSVDPKEEEEDEGEAGEVEEEPSSSESLDWDPVDGMHAEKQRPVRDLTKFFEVQSQRRGFRRHARSFRTRSRTSSLTPTKFWCRILKLTSPHSVLNLCWLIVSVRTYPLLTNMSLSGINEPFQRNAFYSCNLWIR